MASMQKFGGVRVLPLLPANMRKQQEEEDEEKSTKNEEVNCLPTAVGFHDGDNGASGGVTQKQKDSKKEGIDQQNEWVPNSSDGGLQVAKTIYFGSYI